MRPKKFLLSLLYLFTIYFLGSLPAFGCSCRLDPNPTCRAAGEADVVFEAEVLRRETIEPDAEDYLRRRFIMNVKKIHKGSVRKSVYVYTGIGDSDCGYRFKVGSRYLVYAYERNSRLTTGICTRTKKINDAKEDIEYFGALASMPSGATIFGKVLRFESTNGKWDRVGMPEVKIDISGPSGKTLLTDSAGRFSVNGLSPGRYTVKAILPEGFKLSAYSFVELYPYPLYEGDIPDKGCLEAHYVFEPIKSS